MKKLFVLLSLGLFVCVSSVFAVEIQQNKQAEMISKPRPANATDADPCPASGSEFGVKGTLREDGNCWYPKKVVFR